MANDRNKGFTWETTGEKAEFADSLIEIQPDRYANINGRLCGPVKDYVLDKNSGARKIVWKFDAPDTTNAGCAQQWVPARIARQLCMADPTTNERGENVPEIKPVAILKRSRSPEEAKAEGANVPAAFLSDKRKPAIAPA